MNLNAYIREQIRKALLEDYRYQYDQETGGFKPPTDVIGTAKRALEVVNKNPLTSNGGNEGSGTQKAKTLAAGEPLNHSQLKRMKAFFDKNLDKVKQERQAGRDLYSSDLLQKWDLWGGDAGMMWVNREIHHTQKTNITSKKLRPKGTKTLMDPHNTRTHSANHFFTESHPGDVAIENLLHKIYGDHFLDNRAKILDDVYSALGARTINWAFEELCSEYPQLEPFKDEFYQAAKLEGYFEMTPDAWSNGFEKL